MSTGKPAFGVIFILLALFSGSSLTTGAPEVEVTSVDAAQAETVAAREELSPMIQEILNHWDQQQALIAELEEEYASATDERTALSIRQQIEATLIELEIEILRIQLRYARSEGREETAEKLEAAIERFVSPPQFPPAEERPEPADETR